MQALGIRPIDFDSEEKKSYQSLVKIIEDFGGRVATSQIIASTSNTKTTFEKSSVSDEFKKVSKTNNNVVASQKVNSNGSNLDSGTMDGYEIKIDSVVKKKGVDIFKIISNRYMKVMPELKSR